MLSSTERKQQQCSANYNERATGYEAVRALTISTIVAAVFTITRCSSNSRAGIASGIIFNTAGTVQRFTCTSWSCPSVDCTSITLATLAVEVRRNSSSNRGLLQVSCGDIRLRQVIIALKMVVTGKIFSSSWR